MAAERYLNADRKVTDVGADESIPFSESAISVAHLRLSCTLLLYKVLLTKVTMIPNSRSCLLRSAPYCDLIKPYVQF